MNDDVVKVGNSSHRVAIGAETESVELARTGRTGRDPFIRSVQYASVEQFAVLLCLDGEVAVAVELMDSRPVADAPVDQSAAAGQRHAAGPDAAKRKRDVSAPFAGVNETVVDGGLLEQSRSFVVFECALSHRWQTLLFNLFNSFLFSF